MNYEIEHPERKENEIYLGNFSYQEYHNIGWYSKRIGSVAIGIYWAFG